MRTHRHPNGQRRRLSPSQCVCLWLIFRVRWYLLSGGRLETKAAKHRRFASGCSRWNDHEAQRFKAPSRGRGAAVRAGSWASHIDTSTSVHILTRAHKKQHSNFEEKAPSADMLAELAHFFLLQGGLFRVQTCCLLMPLLQLNPPVGLYFHHSPWKAAFDLFPHSRFGLPLHYTLLKRRGKTAPTPKYKSTFILHGFSIKDVYLWQKEKVWLTFPVFATRGQKLSKSIMSIDNTYQLG